MARYFTIRSFFRLVPNALLARYSHKRGLLPDFDFEAMKETQPDALFKAWLAFQFVYPPDSGISKIAIKSIRLSSRVRPGDRVTLEADPKRKREAIYDLLDEFGASTSLHAYNVT